MLLIKNAEVYAPKHLGKKDVLVCGEKIEYMADSIDVPKVPCKVIDASGKKLIPGLIDQHVHITGGGGEGSFHTRAPELQMSEMIENGLTTVVGLLGTDGITRSVENVYAKAMALYEEGVSAYILTGAYDYPSPTITGSIEKDLTFIQNVLGLKLAISDHRAPNISTQDLIQVASKMRVHGMLSGKPGFVALHMGDAKSGLVPVAEAVEFTAIPIKIFRPTHVNRNPRLLEQGYEFLTLGGYVDFTCGFEEEKSPAKCIRTAMERRLPLEHITISSDGHGSWSTYDENGNLLEMGVAGMDALHQELKRMVEMYEIPLEQALTFVTSNVAEGLGLEDKKGCIKPGADGDLVLLDDALSIDTVVARGQVMMEEGRLLKKGTYEK
ncbi:MAG: beta-aspartyl-peptidase [Lachnospiraceae bacterium]|nr:beta-aspartyl-peptidase [Lachnospiraceae bacterium]